MGSSAAHLTVGVTGASGYVGSTLCAHVAALGLDVVRLMRSPTGHAGPGQAREYTLGRPLDASVLDGVDVVVHCAFDLGVAPAAYHEVNVLGAAPLLEACASRSVRFVLVSSLAAFDGCRSRYGAAKLDLERDVLARGGVALRPGLVFGEHPGGMFAELVAQLRARSVVPLVGGGAHRMFVTHDRALCELVVQLLDEDPQERGQRPVFAAHEEPTTLRGVVTDVAASLGRHPALIPVPYPIGLTALRVLERAHVPVPFRSDSLLSSAHPIPLDQVARLARRDVAFPPLTWAWPGA